MPEITTPYQPLSIQSFNGRVAISPDILQFLQGTSGKVFDIGNRVLSQRDKQFAANLALQQAAQQMALETQRLQNYWYGRNQTMAPVYGNVAPAASVRPTSASPYDVTMAFLEQNPGYFSPTKNKYSGGYY